jgi:hypothetical protein
MVPVIEPSIPAALAERARLQLQTVKREVDLGDFEVAQCAGG